MELGFDIFDISKIFSGPPMLKCKKSTIKIFLLSADTLYTLLYTLYTLYTILSVGVSIRLTVVLSSKPSVGPISFDL